jgi:hypothetical protein
MHACPLDPVSPNGACKELVGESWRIASRQCDQKPAASFHGLSCACGKKLGGSLAERFLVGIDLDHYRGSLSDAPEGVVT